MNIGEIISGFKLISNEELKEANSKALLFEHIKTGARLLKLENKDDNKVFGIGFRTPPKNSTGVAHIVEHSVLSGSRKYKTKEPFMDLYKGSLQTFLNAMTFYDKTIYPVASRNKTDFRNLMDVYLDAVFYPAIAEKKEIFMQEGWHYEILEKDEEIRYKGVVYNEMKGAMSSPEDQLQEYVNQGLYPDSIYRYNSGGDPYEIPKLSYEDFIEFHSKYYHPSNSYIYLYGDGDTFEELEYLDSEYLSSFDKIEVDSSIDDQKLFDEKRYSEFEYSTTDEVEGLNRDYLTYSVLTCDILDDSSMISELLKEALIDSDAAPIKKALLDAEICEDVFSLGYPVKQVPFSIAAKNADKNRIKEFEDIIDNELKRLADEGIDKKLLISTLNKFEYNLREASGYPTRGIIYFIEAFRTWLYGESPLEALKYDDVLENLRKGIDEGIYERFIRNNILNNPHKSILSLTPNKGLNDAKDKEQEEELRKFKESLSEEEIDQLISENKKLIEMQLEEDSEEAKATIPKLSLSEINPKLERIPREVFENDGYTLLYHDLFTGGINYLYLVFDMKLVEQEDIPYISVLSELLGSMDTEKRDRVDLASEIYIKTGGIYFSPVVMRDKEDPNNYHPRFYINTKVLGPDFRPAFSLIDEMINETLFDDEKRFGEIIREIKSKIEMSIFQVGNSVVMNRVKSYFDEVSKYNELLRGIDYFNFIQDIEKNLDDSKKHIEKVKSVAKKVFNKDNLIANLTGDRESLTNVQDSMLELINKLPDATGERCKIKISDELKKEGIMSSSNVQYVSKASSLKSTGYKYSGKMAVLSAVLSRGYLHNKIRAMGGAYGAGISIGEYNIATFSYRDPNLKDTVKVYDDIADYLRNIELTKGDLTSYIIGTMGGFNPPMTAMQKGTMDLTMYIQKSSIDIIEDYMREALETEVSDLRGFADMIEKSMGEDYLSVLGNSEKIKENEDLFDNIFNLKK
ncbi:MAG: insulinase family protein [Tissierellia bacterium]|nr:insulinase family protein [Tissierellia bacterium]